MTHRLLPFVALAVLTCHVASQDAAFDEAKFASQFEGGKWNDKHGQAIKFSSSGSNYRCWKPEVSVQADGSLFLSFKVDHIRGMGGDDHAQVTVTVSPKGELVSASASIKIDGGKEVDTGTVTAATLVVAPAAAPVVAVATEIANKLYKALQEDKGGRAHFPTIAQHTINRAFTAIGAPSKPRDTTPPLSPATIAGLKDLGLAQLLKALSTYRPSNLKQALEGTDADTLKTALHELDRDTVKGGLESLSAAKLVEGLAVVNGPNRKRLVELVDLATLRAALNHASDPLLADIFIAKGELALDNPTLKHAVEIMDIDSLRHAVRAMPEETLARSVAIVDAETVAAIQSVVEPAKATVVREAAMKRK